MPDKLQSLSDKIIHIRGNGVEPDKQLPVKYLSEIITARVEEIIMSILYEIEQSGFADMLRSGIVITGGSAKLANLGNFIYDISGFKVRIGYPKKCFSCIDCDGITEPSSATSIGLLISALADQTVNCAVDSTTARILTEVETADGKEIKVEVVGVGEVGTEENPQGTIWADKDIEKVIPPKKEKIKKNGIFNVTFTKINTKLDQFKTNLTNGILDLYQDIAEDEPQEKA